MKLADTELAGERSRQVHVLTDLKVERAGIEGQRKMVEVDVAPVRYFATLLGAGDQNVVRWFILVVALLAAVRPRRPGDRSTAPHPGRATLLP
jgi:hypothetical protein